VRPETALLVAVVVAICAVLVAGSAVLVVRVASTRRADLVRRREAIGRTSVHISRDAAFARDWLEDMTVALEQVRVESRSRDDDFDRLTDSLRMQRADEPRQASWPHPPGTSSEQGGAIRLPVEVIDEQRSWT
jgi:hypothetical protein